MRIENVFHGAEINKGRERSVMLIFQRFIEVSDYRCAFVIAGVDWFASKVFNRGSAKSLAGNSALCRTDILTS